MDLNKTIICPSCGWTGTIEQLTEPYRDCPACGYENNVHPLYRLFTISEMLEDTKAEHDDVRFGLFLRSLFRIIDYIYEDVILLREKKL